MGWYEKYVVPPMIDLACSAKPVRKQREKIVPRARGDVLEIGIGSGLNLPYYDREQVSHVWGLEPSEELREKARRRLEDHPLPLDFIDLPGEQIPLDDNSVDTVLLTYTLCTIPDPLTALEGMRRVLKPGGTLLFCEHGRAPDASVQKWQDRLNGTWCRLAGGCNMNRDIPALLREGGFRIVDEERMYIPGLRVLSYNYWGAASGD